MLMGMALDTEAAGVKGSLPEAGQSMGLVGTTGTCLAIGTEAPETPLSSRWLPPTAEPKVSKTPADS